MYPRKYFTLNFIINEIFCQVSMVPGSTVSTFSKHIYIYIYIYIYIICHLKQLMACGSLSKPSQAPVGFLYYYNDKRESHMQRHSSLKNTLWGSYIHTLTSYFVKPRLGFKQKFHYSAKFCIHKYSSTINFYFKVNIITPSSQLKYAFLMHNLF